MNILIRHIRTCATAMLLLASAAAAQTTGSLSGRIYDASNVPLQNAIIRLLGTPTWAATKGDGRFLISGIPAGHYRVQISATGYPSKIVVTRINPDRTTQLNEGFSPSYGMAPYGDEVVFFNPARQAVYLPFHATIADAALSLKAYRLEETLEPFLAAYPGVPAKKPAAPEKTARTGNRLAAIWDYNVTPGTIGGIEIPAPMREPGVYGVEVRNASQTLRKSYTVVVSEIGMIVKQTGEGVVAYLANAITGEREIGFPVTAAINGTPLGTFTSREDGTIVIPVPPTEQPAVRTMLFYGEHNGDILLVNSTYNGLAAGDRSQIFLHTDKPIYRPEQSVNFRGIARKSRGSNDYATVSGGLAYAEMRDSRGSTVARDTARISDLGTFSGSFQLGAEPPLGGYTIVARVADMRGSSSFAVEEYKKPEFAVAVEMSRSSFKAGEPVEATVKARYFFGSPVARAQVEYSIYRTPMPGSDAPAPGSATAEERTTMMIHTARGELKEDGTYTISYPTSKEDRRNYTYAIRADVADNSRRTVSANGSASVAHGHFKVTVETARNLYIAPDRMEAAVRISRFDGKRGEKIPFILSARRIRWQMQDDGTSRQQTEILRNIAGVTDEEGNATVGIGTIEGGYLELRAEAVSGADTSFGFRYVYSYDGVFDDWSSTFSGMQIILEKEIASPGERLRALVIPPAPGLDLFISTEGSRLHSYQVSPALNSMIVDIPVNEALAPNFFLAVYAFSNGRQINAIREITVPPEHRRIDLRIATDKESYKPGEKGRLMIRARDHRGRPMRGVDVALAGVDASIYEISPDITSPMLAAFYAPLANAVATQEQIGPDHKIINNYLNAYRTRKSEIATINSTGGGNGISIRGGRTKVTSAVIDFNATDIIELAAMAEDAIYPTASVSDVREIEVPSSGFRADYGDLLSGAVAVTSHRPPPVIRSDFRDVMLWLPSVRTDSKGLATVDIAFPDNLTTWRFAARGIDRNTSVGETKQDVVARKNLLVRMETPRFMTQGDELAIATTVHNYLPVAQTVQVQFAGRNLAVADHSRTVTIPAKGESRIDWQVTASTLDTARMAVRALGDDESDAMEISVPVLPRGLQRSNSSTVRLARETSLGTMQFEIPQGSSPEGRSLNISLSPSVSSSMMGALDDLIGYPYGCAEQTMTRFLPTIVVANAVRQLDIPFDTAKLAEMPKMVQAGLDRLYGFQHADGGWGWWEHDETHPFMTAYIMYGLSVARTAGYQVDEARFDRGFASLRRQIESRAPAGNYGEERITLDAPSEAYMLYVASFISRDHPDKLYNQRTAALAATPGINDYAVALLALAASQQGDLKLASALSGQLAKTAHQTDSTVNWSGQTWDHSWQNDRVETSAYALKALLGSSSRDEMISRSVDWLMLQRNGNSWGNTRQTAMVLYTLIDYVRQMSLSSSEYRIAVKVNGRVAFNRKLTRDELLGPDIRIAVGAADLRDGTNEITIEKSGDGGLVASAALTYYTEVSAIRAADNGFSVEREYFTLRKEKSGEGYIYRKYPFTGTVASGEEMLVRIKVRSDRKREYFMLEDPLPAGCEVVNDVDGFIIEGESEYSGAPAGVPGTWRWWYASRELRDEKIAFFATALEPAEYEFSYILRAQIPGIYNVMPSLGMLTYYPEVYGNSNPLRMTITEKRPARPEEELPSLH